MKHIAKIKPIDFFIERITDNDDEYGAVVDMSTGDKYLATFILSLMSDLTYRPTIELRESLYGGRPYIKSNREYSFTIEDFMIDNYARI